MYGMLAGPKGGPLMCRFALALMMALFVGEADAQSIQPAQPSAPDAPRRFSGEPFGPLDLAYVRSLPAMMREGVVTLHAACLVKQSNRPALLAWLHQHRFT